MVLVCKEASKVKSKFVWIVVVEFLIRCMH